MAAKTSRQTYGTKLRHCHPVYTVAHTKRNIELRETTRHDRIKKTFNNSMRSRDLSMFVRLGHQSGGQLRAMPVAIKPPPVVVQSTIQWCCDVCVIEAISANESGSTQLIGDFACSVDFD